MYTEGESCKATLGSSKSGSKTGGCMGTGKETNSLVNRGIDKHQRKGFWLPNMNLIQGDELAFMNWKEKHESFSY